MKNLTEKLKKSSTEVSNVIAELNQTEVATFDIDNKEECLELLQGVLKVLSIATARVNELTTVKDIDKLNKYMGK